MQLLKKQPLIRNAEFMLAECWKCLAFQKADIMTGLIKDIYKESKYIYGAPKITKELHKKGFNTAERTVTRYMKEMGIRAYWVKPYTVITRSEDFSNNLKNILKRNFSPKSPNAVWCTDIIYIPTRKGFVYLSCIMDLFSRKIVSWELAPTLETYYVVKAI